MSKESRDITIIAPGDQLPVQAPGPSWPEEMASDEDDVPSWPVAWQGRINAATNERYDVDPAMLDAALRAWVTPEMRASVAPESAQALARLTQSIGKFSDLETEHFLESLGTLIRFDGVPWRLAHNDIAERLMLLEPERRTEPVLRKAAVMPPGLSDWVKAGVARRLALEVKHELVEPRIETFHEAFQRTNSALFTLKSRTVPTRPTFDCDQFGRMAMHVRQEVEAMPAAERERYADADALIHGVLRTVKLLDPVSNKPVELDNKIIAQVRGALARTWRLSPTGTMPPTALLTASPIALIAAFANERLTLDPEAWTLTKALWQAWVAWCEERGAAPGTEAVFGRRLMEWGGDRIQPSRPRSKGRLPGYAGISLRATP
jgi:hypothetical protein